MKIKLKFVKYVGGEIIVAQHMNDRAVYSTVPHGLHGTARNPACGVDACDLVCASQRHIVDQAHVVSHHAAYGHGEGVLTANVHILNGQILHLAQVHADHTDTADRVIRMEGNIGDRMSLAVQRAFVPRRWVFMQLYQSKSSLSLSNRLG